MEFIIDFFRGIDGWVYYTMLVINTILIFAIIGYLGEKNNEQLIKMGMNTATPDLRNGAMNLNPVHASPSHNDASIPKVAATQASQNVTTTQAIPVVNSVNNNSQGNVQQTSTSPAINSAIPTINPGAKPIIRPEDNEVDPNEKAPSVLIINSSDVNKDAK